MLLKGIKMISLAYKEADNFVDKLQHRGVNVRWNGWNMVFFKKDNRAKYSPNGRRVGNEWGWEQIVSPNANGKWLVHESLTKVNG